MKQLIKHPKNRIIKEKYDNGLSDTNDLLEADVEQLGSKINKALAKANVIQNITNCLYQRTIKPNLQSFKKI
jgi:hypothetical protein